MKYEKPELGVLAPAVDAVKGHPATKSSIVNVEQFNQQPTLAAYEADE